MFVTLLVLTPIAIIKKLEFRTAPHFPVKVLTRQDGHIYRMDLEEYLVGVLAAEMPAKFSLEALKAQAVAARTVAVNRLPRFGGKGCLHWQGADFCDDPAENQAWVATSQLKQRWSSRDYEENYRKIQAAVQETTGIIMVYQNHPIDAVFHSTCGVGTATAKEVWNNDIPYLQGVSCGFDHNSPRYLNQISFTWREVTSALSVSTNSLRQLKVLQRSPQGRILLLGMGNYRISGNEFRKRLGLTSNCFGWQATATGILFKSIGYGHGVGLCQYGADGMAKQGWNYRQILFHYYRGIQLSKIK